MKAIFAGSQKTFLERFQYRYLYFCTQKTERQKFIDFGQNILWALCEWNAMINTLKIYKVNKKRRKQEMKKKNV